MVKIPNIPNIQNEIKHHIAEYLTSEKYNWIDDDKVEIYDISVVKLKLFWWKQWQHSHIKTFDP